MFDGTNEILEKTEQVVQDLKWVGVEDIRELSKIYARLEWIADELRTIQPGAADWAGSLVAAMEKIILDECGGAEDPLDTVRRGTAVLKRLMDSPAENRTLSVDEPDLVRDIVALAGIRPAPAGAAGKNAGPHATSQPEFEEVREPVEEDSAEDTPEGGGDTRDTAEVPVAPDADAEDAWEWPDEDREAPGVDDEGPEASDGSGDSVQDRAEGVQDVIEQIALDIMTVGLDDLSGLGTIHTRLEKIAAGPQGVGPTAAGLAASLGSAVERVILDECGDVDDPLDLLARGVALLQRIQMGFERTGKEAVDDPDLFQEITQLAGTEDEVRPVLEETQDGEPIEAPPQETPALAAEPPAASQTHEDAALQAETAVTGAFGVDPDIFSDFATEAEEHLDSAESHLLSLESNPEDAEILNAVFRSFHTIKGAAGFLNLNDITHVAHAVEDVLDSARKGRLKLNASILDSAFESIDLLKGLLAAVQARLDGGDAPALDVSGFLAKVAQTSGLDGPPVEAGIPEPENQEIVEEGPKPGPAPAAAQPPAPQNRGAAAGEARYRDQRFVRVGTEKLDQMVNLVGELVIAQTQVSQNPEIRGSSSQKLAKDISQLVKISNDIQEIAMSMRMVPIKSTFERMARMVRDLARKCGKQVAFQMSGEDTELDKNVVEEIVDPLTHMVRNAVDHGVEPAEVRRAAGKPERGTVTLEAYHKGGNIVIELKDDGKGLDREKILKKAVERGLARADEDLTDEQVYAFVFHPGLSTAEKVSDVSGRGVGMDVVRRNIEKLRGKVEVTSTKGKGSTFTIRLPLTLAIIDGMVIAVGQERYILPITAILRSLRPQEHEVFSVMGKGEMVKVQDELFPLLRLHERFGVKANYENPCEGLVILIEAEDGRCSLLVDELIGMQQVVIKGLDEDLRCDKCFSGCAILGDGQVGLILDANGLVSLGNGKATWDAGYRAAS